MALVKCPNCGKEYSEHAEKCPNCGLSMDEAKIKATEKKKNTTKVIKYIGIAVLCVILIFVLIKLFRATSNKQEYLIIEEPEQQAPYQANPSPEAFYGYWKSNVIDHGVIELYITEDYLQSYFDPDKADDYGEAGCSWMYRGKTVFDMVYEKWRINDEGHLTLYNDSGDYYQFAISKGGDYLVKVNMENDENPDKRYYKVQ